MRYGEAITVAVLLPSSFDDLFHLIELRVGGDGHLESSLKHGSVQLNAGRWIDEQRRQQLRHTVRRRRTHTRDIKS